MPGKVLLLILIGVWSVLPLEHSVAGYQPSEECPFSIRVLVEEERPIKDEPFLMRIVVEGVHDAAVQMSEVSEALHWVFLEKRREMVSDLVFEGGVLQRRETPQVVFQYSITAEASGEIPVPPFAVTSGRCRCDGPAVRFTVHGPSEAPQGTFHLTLSKASVYAYEVATLGGLLYLPEDAEIVAMRVPLFELPGCGLMPEKSSAVTQGMPLSISLPFTKVAAAKRLVQIAGEPSQEIRFNVPFLISTPGHISVPAATVRYRVKGRTGQTFAEARSEAMEMQVLPLPGDNQPDGFEPLVGKYGLRVEAHPLQVVPGQAVTIRTTLNGTGRLQLQDPTRLWSSSEWRENFEIPREVSPPETTAEGLLIVQTVRPRHPAVKRIPPLKLAYFDPQTGAYTEAESEPIGLRVAVPRDVGPIVGAMGSKGKEIGRGPGQPEEGERARMEPGFSAPANGDETAAALWLGVAGSPMAALGPFGAFLFLRAFRRLWERLCLCGRIRAFRNECRCRWKIHRMRRVPYPHPYVMMLRETLRRCTLGDADRPSEAFTTGELIGRFSREGEGSDGAAPQRLWHAVDRALYAPSWRETLAREELESLAMETVRFLWGPGHGVEMRSPDEGEANKAPEMVHFTTPARDGLPSGGSRGERGVSALPARPVWSRDRWSKIPPTGGRSAFVFLGLCCFMASLVIWHSPLHNRAGIKSSPPLFLKTAEGQCPSRILSKQPQSIQGTTDGYLEALLLEKAVRNASRPDVSSYARLARLYAGLGDAGRAVLWQRRAEWLLGASALEKLRHFRADHSESENSRYPGSVLIILATGELFTGPHFRLFALGCYWFYGFCLCLLLTGRFKGLPKPWVPTVAVLSLTALSLVATGDFINRRFPLGVVTAFSASAFTGPGPAFSSAGRHFLPVGTLFRVLDEAEGRLKVLTRKGETVWISANFTEFL